MIHAVKRALAHHVPMIVSPTPDFGVEFVDQVGGRHAQRSFAVLRMPPRKVLTFFLEGLMSSFPLGYLRTFCPRKSKPFSTCVMTVFVGESSSPRFCRNCSTRGLTSPSSNSFDLPVMTKSSAYRMRLTQGLIPFEDLRSSLWVLLLQELLKSIQRSVSERRGDNTALWRPIGGFMKDVFFHIPGGQPSS